MARLFTRAAALAALLGLPALSPAEDPRPGSDEDFVMKASSAGMFEVQSSEMAPAQATSEAVKKFAKQMIDDHTKANRELLDLAAKKKFPVATRMLKPHADVASKLTAAKGADFDAQYIKAQVAAHDEAVKLFEGQAKNGKDADLKAWAEKTLPTLKEHQRMAQGLAKK